MYNKVVLLGRLGQDPDVRVTQNGTMCVNASLATNRIDKNKTTDWHKIVIWGKAAEVCERYCKKGTLILVEGELQYRNFEGKDGNKVYMTEIVCHQIKLVEPKSHGAGDTTSAPASTYTEADVPF